MKWFYHAAETEGTAKGGGRVEDIKTPVGKLFVLLYVEDIRTPISLFNCVPSLRLCSFKCVYIYLEDINTLVVTIVCVFVQIRLQLPWGHLCCAVFLCLSLRECSLVISPQYP